MVPNHSFPLRHLHRVNLIFSGNLPDRFDAHQCFQSNFCFEGTRVSLPLSSFAHSSAVLSHPAEPEKPNSAHCPNFGVHFTSTLRRIFGVLKDRRMFVRVTLVWKQTLRTWRLGFQHVEFAGLPHVHSFSPTGDFAAFCVSHTSSGLSLVVNRLP